MPLTEEQINILRDAITIYHFPCVYYDFENEHEVSCPIMAPVEESIRNDLISGDNHNVKNGLSNVLYWGFAQVGFRDTRVTIFRSKVTNDQLDEAAALFQDQNNIILSHIKNIKLPQFSGMSFVSKIAMFINPNKYAILDKQILKMKHTPVQTLLDEISFCNSETRIRISKNNDRVYSNWCNKCKEISSLYFNGLYRTVDIERGFFTLIQNGNVIPAAEILSNA